jgi:hypothetical protein
MEIKMKKIFILLFLLLLIEPAVSVFAQSKVGTAAANFLTIPVGPRAAGMGGAFIAEANDVYGAYWNPGGLSRIGRTEFSASFSTWIAATKHNWFGLNYALSEDDAVALSINQLDYGEEEITTEANPDGTGQRWSASDIALSLSYARNLTDRFSIGGTIKYINQKIWNESASAFAIDIGLLFYTELPGLRIGMNIANFGTEMKLAGDDLLQPVDVDPANAGNNANIAADLGTSSWALPLVFAVGVGYDFINADSWKFTLETDAMIPSNKSSYLNVGGEFSWNDMVYLRGGFNSLFLEGRQGGLSGGIGVHYDFGGFFAKVDYSYTDFGVFSGIQRVAFTVGL